MVTNVGTLSPPLGTEASPTFVGDKRGMHGRRGVRGGAGWASDSVPPRHPCIPRRYDSLTGSGRTPMPIIAVGDIGHYITNGIGVTVAVAV